MKHIRIAAALLLAAAAACDSPTDGRRGPGLPDITPGVAVEESVQPGAADEFDLVASAGEFRIMLRARSGNAADTLIAELLDEKGPFAERAVSVGTDTSLTAQASPWLTAAEGTRWRIRVRGAGPDDGGPYTLRIYPRSTAPESRPAALALGETVEGETLEVADDVDEFTLEGTAGQEWIVFVQSLLGGIDTRLNVQLAERASGDVVATLPVEGPSQALEQLSSGRLRLPRTGTYVLRVTSGSQFRPQVRGGYRLRVDAVNRAPESGSAAVQLGAVFADAIHPVGDVDEFTFTAAAGQEMNLLVQLTQGMSSGLRVELLRDGSPAGGAPVATAPAASLNEVGSGRITLEGGQYTVRVSGEPFGVPATATGAYRIELYPVDRRPEAPGELRLDGPAVTGAVDRPGDVDEFTLSGTAGQMVVLTGAGAAGTSQVLWAELLAPGGAVAAGPLALLGTGTDYSLRRTLPVTGTYTLRVYTPVAYRMDWGPYSLSAYTVSPAPEHVPATLAVGQTQQGERIDRPGDLDVFRLETPQLGQELAVFMGSEPTAMVVGAVRGVGDNGPPMFVMGGAAGLDAGSTGRFRTEHPAYEVVVDPQALPSVGSSARQGSFGIRVLPIDRRPEGRAQAYAPGDTVRNEPLYPAVDVDEYTFELAATTTMRILWTGASSDPAFGGPQGNLINEGTGQPVWSSSLTINGVLARQMTFPAGRYRLVVDGGPRPQVLRYTYQFSFTPQ